MNATMITAMNYRQQQETRSSILLVGDRPSTGTLAGALRGDGYHVIASESARHFLRRFNALWCGSSGRSLELVVLNLKSSWVSLRLLEYVRRIDWAVPVIVISDGSRKMLAEARRLGATATLDDGFDLDDLRTAVINSVPLCQLRVAN